MCICFTHNASCIESRAGGADKKPFSQAKVVSFIFGMTTTRTSSYQVLQFKRIEAELHIYETCPVFIIYVQYICYDGAFCANTMGCLVSGQIVSPNKLLLLAVCLFVSVNRGNQTTPKAPGPSTSKLAFDARTFKYPPFPLPKIDVNQAHP